MKLNKKVLAVTASGRLRQQQQHRRQRGKRTGFRRGKQCGFVRSSR